MKIKELHLRNIASIEEADIDFEKDLKDGVSGKDAPIFLISGDTGTGKSAILDGISMALYKTTPRIAGVANVNNNAFSNAEGESIRVGSIEQYTRLGISEKDECYSEVVFTGNDGIEYRAKLTLGLLLGTTDKVTGQRPIKHRSPEWTIKEGSNDWVKCNEKIIYDAVGLSFQQFGRMAMLAQGQFASFLTGDKKERESILEQLTNTEHFTAYGKAIKSLFDKAKENVALIETEYKNEKTHIISQEEVNKMLADKEERQKKKEDVDKEAAANDETLVQINKIEDNRSIAEREKANKAKSEAIVNGEKYKSDKALVADWDATTEERHKLSEKKKAEENLDAATANENVQKGTFTVLCADLQARREDIKAQGDPQKAVDDKQAEIDTLTHKRDELNPAKINDDLSKLSTEKVELSTISTIAEAISKDEAAVTKLEAELEEDKKKEKEADKAYTKAKTIYDAAKSECDEKNSRLTTMSTSIDKTLVNLRKRLAQEHEEKCPLCGQPLNGILREEDFKDIVTPFENEYKIAKDACDAAELSCNEAKTDLDRCSGAIKAKTKDLETKKSNLTAAKTDLGAAAAKYGINIAQSLPEQLAKKIESLVKQEGELQKAQKSAEDLQKQIDKAGEDKKPLDKALKKYTSDAQTIANIEGFYKTIVGIHPDWEQVVKAQSYDCANITSEWNKLSTAVTSTSTAIGGYNATINECNAILKTYYAESGKTEVELVAIDGKKSAIDSARQFVKDTDNKLLRCSSTIETAEAAIAEALAALSLKDEKDIPQKQELIDKKEALRKESERIFGDIKTIDSNLKTNDENAKKLAEIENRLDGAKAVFNKWDILNGYFGGTRFRTLVQTYILRPLLNNANTYLNEITKRYSLTCSEDNEQLSIFVVDRHNKDQIRSVTVLSGGERFMISLALSLALSSLNRPDMNVNILFIDEGFGTLDEKNLDSVMQTLEKLQEIAGNADRRVGIISHREELEERIPVQIRLKKKGDSRSGVEIRNIL